MRLQSLRGSRTVRRGELPAAPLVLAWASLGCYRKARLLSKHVPLPIRTLLNIYIINKYLADEQGFVVNLGHFRKFLVAQAYPPPPD